MIEPDYVNLIEIKPVLTGYIREAQSLLRRSPIPDEEAVHDIRVLMKRSRAVMRLIDNQVDRQAFQREYITYREVGRLMCSWREDSVHRKTLKYLRKKRSGLFTLLKDNEKINTLMKKPVTSSGPVADMNQVIEEIESLLEKSGYRLRFMNMKKPDPRLLIEKLEKSYNIVTDKYLTARNNTKPENLHMLRKKTKDFLYQLYFFRTLNPTTVKSLEKKLDSLTQSLGRYNDLAQLIDTIGYKYSGKNNTPALDQLVLVIREEQDKYLMKVWPQIFKIFGPGKNLINLLGFKVLIIR